MQKLKRRQFLTCAGAVMSVIAGGVKIEVEGDLITE